ncbi:hypothetical protein AAY473_022838 [Plecturocebus cupreus]
MIVSPQPPSSWDYRSEPAHPAKFSIFYRDGCWDYRHAPPHLVNCILIFKNLRQKRHGKVITTTKEVHQSLEELNHKISEQGRNIFFPHCHIQLFFRILVETRFHHVAQAGLELLSSGNPPASASQSAKITGVPCSRNRVPRGTDLSERPGARDLAPGSQLLGALRPPEPRSGQVRSAAMAPVGRKRQTAKARLTGSTSHTNLDLRPPLPVRSLTGERFPVLPASSPRVRQPRCARRKRPYFRSPPRGGKWEAGGRELGLGGERPGKLGARCAAPTVLRPGAT